MSFWIAFKPSLTASISFFRSSFVGCCAAATRADRRQVRTSPTDRLDFRRFIPASFLAAFSFLQAGRRPDPAPALYGHALVGVVSDLAMTNDTLLVHQQNGRRAADAIRGKGLPEGIHGNLIEERVPPAFQEVADRILVFVSDRKDGQPPALGKGHHLGHRLLAGAAPGGPEEQDAGAPLETRPVAGSHALERRRENGCQVPHQRGA